MRSRGIGGMHVVECGASRRSRLRSGPTPTLPAGRGGLFADQVYRDPAAVRGSPVFEQVDALPGAKR